MRRRCQDRRIGHCTLNRIPSSIRNVEDIPKLKRVDAAGSTLPFRRFGPFSTLTPLPAFGAFFGLGLLPSNVPRTHDDKAGNERNERVKTETNRGPFPQNSSHKISGAHGKTQSTKQKTRKRTPRYLKTQKSDFDAIPPTAQL